MKFYDQERQFLQEYWETRSFPQISDAQIEDLKAHAKSWADWTRQHRGIHNALTLAVFLILAAIEFAALWVVPQVVSSWPLAVLIGSFGYGFVMYSTVIYAVHECGAHKLGFLGDGPLVQHLQSLAANASRLQFADPGFYREQHKTHHRYLGTERDETNAHFVWPKRFFTSLLPGAAVLPFNDYKVDPGTPCPGRKTTNIVGFGFFVLCFGVSAWAGGPLYAAALTLVLGPWIAFVLDRLRESSEHQLMPVDHLQGARNLGPGFWGTLVGGGPWGQPCHLSHHLFPQLPWYSQIAMHWRMQAIFNAEQRAFFLGEGTLFPALMARIVRTGTAFQARISGQGADSDRLTATVTESMLVGEHPKEPLGIWLHFDLAEDTPAHWFDRKNQLRLIAEVIEAEPQLRTVWALSDLGELMSFPSKKSTRELAEAVFSRSHLSADAFLHESTDNVGGPNFFLRLDPKEGASLKCHHSVMDGRAVMDFLQKFLVHLDSGEPWTPVGLPPGSASGMRWALTLPIGLFLGFARLIRNSRNPAFLFADRRAYAGTRIHYRSKPIGMPWLEGLLVRARSRVTRLSSTELVLAAYHRALANLAVRKSGTPANRIATMMTIDGFNGGRDSRPFSNYSLGESISVTPEEVKDVRQLIAAIQRQSTRGWTTLFPGKSSIRWVRSLLQLHSFLKIPYFRRAAAYKAANGSPLRTSNDSDTFGKQADTALFSSLGRTPLPAPLVPWVTAMYGHAPFMNPMGISLTYALDGPVTFNLAASDTCLSAEETDALLNDLHIQTERIVEELESP